MTIQTNRTLGIAGTSLILVGAVSTLLTLFGINSPSSVGSFATLGISGVVGILAFVGFILFLIAMYGFSRDYGEHRIFNYLLYGIIGSIISGVVIGVVSVIIVLLSFLSSPSLPTGPSASPTILMSYLSPLTLVISLTSLVWVFFNYRAFTLLAEKSTIPLFSSAAKTFVIGAVLTVGVYALFVVLGSAGMIDYDLIVLAAIPGGIVQYIAWGLAVKAFSNIQIPSARTDAPAAYSTAMTQIKYCSKCGAPNKLDAVYCSRCGQQL